ncbi:EAL domain-containing protein [Trinickia violacea]|uniref:EAL domain-containing protein n=1 Tax=Trinickia violacea TaxID=2571746 RepID=A0A4P8IMJ7_9BURK|nr:EAL domain-containing protein [Trinickia violacea]QCP49027.1 EAL domain-containing protein [Trinickia violacea]
MVENPSTRTTQESECVYLGRQPIIERNGALNAYELLFRSSSQNYALVTNDAQATAQVVARTIGGIGVSAALGTHRGYVNINRELLFDDIIHVMSPERFVLEVLETVSFDARLIARIDKLRRAGYAVALDDVCELSDGLLSILNHVDIVKVDFLQTPRPKLAALAEAVRARGKTLIAEKVETQEDFALARQLGFDMFQGYYFARPQVLTARRTDPSRRSLLRMLALLASDAKLTELEAELKHNPEVVVQLLRLVNSSAYGLGRRIASLREAIIAAGTRQIARWAQLLLYADSGDLPWRVDPLVQLAGARSRFMELAASRVRPDDERFVDAAFMTGIFSLVHVVLGVASPAEALDKLGLVSEIRDAIVYGVGPLGALLAIAQAGEEGGAERLTAAAQLTHDPFAMLTPEVLGELSLAAAAWFGVHADE